MPLIYDNSKKPKFVYRYEDSHMEGPYISRLKMDSTYPPAHQPGARDDFSIKDQDEARLHLGYPRFGFLTKKDALRWFDKSDRDKFDCYGVKLKRMPACKIWLSYSKKQIMFWRA